MELSWQTRSMYAQLMVHRVVYAVASVELHKEREIKILHRGQEAKRQEMASIVEGRRLHALLVDQKTGEKKEHKEDGAGEKKTLFNMATTFASALANKIVDTVDGTWTCKHCTYENKALHLQCLICQKENDTVSPLSSLVSSATNFASGQKISTSSEKTATNQGQETAVEAHWKSLFATPSNQSNGFVKIWNQKRDHLFQAKTISDLVTLNRNDSEDRFFRGYIRY